MRDDQESGKHVDEAMTALYRALASASDDYDFQAGREAGTITVEFMNRPAKFVITPHAGVPQVWVSANGKTYKLDWDVVENTFVLTSTGHTLKELVAEAISRQLGDEVTL